MGRALSTAILATALTIGAAVPASSQASFFLPTSSTLSPALSGLNAGAAQADTAGRLYLANAQELFTPHELDTILEEVVRNYEAAGIRFRDPKIIARDEFPALSGLDMIIYMCDDYPGKSIFGAGLAAEYYDQLRAVVPIPYGSLAASAHVGIVSYHREALEMKCAAARGIGPKNILIPLIGAYLAQIHAEVKREDMVRYVMQLTTHEIGHGLGAAHVDYIIPRIEQDRRDTSWDTDASEDHYMGACDPTRDQRFTPRNISGMRAFIHQHDGLGENDLFLMIARGRSCSDIERIRR